MKSVNVKLKSYNALYRHSKIEVSRLCDLLNEFFKVSVSQQTSCHNKTTACYNKESRVFNESFMIVL